MNNTNRIYKNRDKPSNFFCQTGRLENDEKYNPDLHLFGQNAQERCSEFYTPTEINRMNNVMRRPYSKNSISYIYNILSKPIIIEDENGITHTYMDPRDIYDIIDQIIYPSIGGKKKTRHSKRRNKRKTYRKK